MESLSTGAEKYNFFNTLLCLVKSLENRCTTIDLRNETSVTGKITQVDGYMNVVLEDAALYDSDGRYQYLPLLYIQGRNIRNVHIPDNVPIRKTIEKQVLPQKKREKVRRTFKQSRAQKQQQETLNLISGMKKAKETMETKVEPGLPSTNVKEELQSPESP